MNTDLHVDVEQGRGRKVRIKVRMAGELIHSDTLDPHDAAARIKLARALAAKSRTLSIDVVERRLLSALDRTPTAGVIEDVNDPDRLARRFLEWECQGPGGYTLRSYRGKWFRWDGESYRNLPEGELDAELVPRFKAEFDRYSLETKTAAPKVTRSLLDNVRLALKSKLLVPESRSMPCWLGDGPWPVGEVLPARNGLFHLPSLAEGVASHIPPTPKFFSTFALDYDISMNPDPPAVWLRFLSELWPDNPECIDTLQEFMGYALTPDTRQQKILLVIGPTRCGKGTIGRAMAGLVGERNVAGATASGLKASFGLQELVGKLLAILADAQLKRHDDDLVERIKMISGEDLISIDKKYVDSFTLKLPTRLVILSNDLPRLRDTSGALVSRYLILPLVQSFLGREDPTLGEKLLLERPGILSWAVAGWKRLQERDRFLQPATGVPLLEALRDLSSSIGQFVREACRVGAFETPRDQLYNAYKKWCLQRGRNYPISSNTFGAELRAAVPGLGDARPLIDGRQVRCYTGIAPNE